MDGIKNLLDDATLALQSGDVSVSGVREVSDAVELVIEAVRRLEIEAERSKQAATRDAETWTAFVIGVVSGLCVGLAVLLAYSL